jgi:hypothetical protein
VTAAAAPRVLLVHPSADLYGSDRVALESAAALAGAGGRVVATLTASGPLQERLADVGAEVVVTPAPVLRKSLLSPRGVAHHLVEVARRTPAMVRLLRRSRPDVVYVSTVTVPWWIVLARLSGARVVVHVHEAEDALPRSVRTALAAPLVLAHDVLANSEVSRALLLGDLPVLRRRCRVVHNGVPGPARVEPPRAELTGPVRLVVVGRVSPRKGTDTAVAAVRALLERGVDATLDVVGGVVPGNERFEAELRERAERDGTAGRVRWRGVLPDVWPALAEADIALVPSWVESFGNAAVEAMLAARPLVAGSAQGLREIVRSGENGLLVAPGDVGALADAVTTLVSDWPAARARAVTAREEALRRFSVDRYRAEIVTAVLGPGGAVPAPPSAVTPGRHGPTAEGVGRPAVPHASGGSP